MKKVIAIGVIGIAIVSMVCGCVEYEEPTPTYKPVRAVSGVNSVYDYANNECERIVISGVGNTVYVDWCDEVVMSGMDNEIIRR